jgi:hypothetical protein
MRARTPAWVLLLLLTLLIGACGGSKSSGDQDKVKAVFKNLVAAINAHDGAAACRLFTPQGRLQFERYQNEGSSQPRLRCEALMKDLTVPGERLVGLKVAGTRATSGLLDDGGKRLNVAEPVAFAKVNGRWLVDKFGPFGP